MHQESSVHGKLDRVLLLLEDPNIGLCPRVTSIEKTLTGTRDAPGLCEKVRTLQKDNTKQAVWISLGVAGLLQAGWAYARHKLGW